MPSTRHAHICDHAAVLELGKLVQKNLAGIESAHTEACSAEQEIQRVAYCRIVVDDIDVLTLRHRSDLWRARRAG